MKKRKEKRSSSGNFKLICLCSFIGIAFLSLPKSISAEENPTRKVRELNIHKDENKSAFAKLLTDTNYRTVYVDPSTIKPEDTARLNLLCAKGLPGAENLDIDKCLSILEKWAARVKSETEKYLYKFKENPQEYYNSEAYFRMALLVTVLQQDFGIHYNMDLASFKYTTEELTKPFTKDSRNVFLHGLLTGKRQGTCASMPVLYLVIARMQEYPVKLVTTRAHLFLRWEDDKERINLEATGQGLSVYSDEHYRNWPIKISEKDEKEYRYLKSLSPLEEYITFLSIRASIFHANGDLGQMGEIFKKIREYDPDNAEAREYCRAEINQRQHYISIQKKKVEEKQQLYLKRISVAQTELQTKHKKQLEKIKKDFEQTALDPRANHHKAYMQKINASAFQEKIYDMKLAELENLKLEIVSKNSGEITQEQIDVLLGKKELPSLQHYKKQLAMIKRNQSLKYNAMKRNRSHQQQLNKTIDILKSQEKENLQNLMLLKARDQIIAARNLRQKHEETENHKLKILKEKLLNSN